AIFQSATGKFLPQDEDFLRMTVKDLCGIGDARIVHFMFHDRVSFGGSIHCDRNSVPVAARIPHAIRRKLELVGLLDQRNYRVRQLPGLSRVWVSRHLAWDRDGFSPGSVRLWDNPHRKPVEIPSRNGRTFSPRPGILMGFRFGGTWTSARYRL